MTDKPERKYTDMQMAFRRHLLGEARGDMTLAKKLAGYADSVSVSEIVKSLRDELIEDAKDAIAMNGVRAAFVTGDVLTDPSQKGAKMALTAANSILDRIGVTKTSNDLNLQIPDGGLVILPAKRKKDDNEIDDAKGFR